MTSKPQAASNPREATGVMGNGGPAECCGPWAADATQSCPCGSALKRHRAVIFTVIAVMVLAFLISQVGGILGIIGFARTF